jgi:Tfp pilus assembly protein PilF
MKKMKSWILGLGLLVSNMAFAQTVQDGLNFIDRHQPNRAKQVFESLVASAPTGENYFYLGYYFLHRRDWDSAKAAFEKGRLADPKNFSQSGWFSVYFGRSKQCECCKS